MKLSLGHKFVKTRGILNHFVVHCLGPAFYFGVLAWLVPTTASAAINLG